MSVVFSLFVFFLFKQKTAYEMRISDWSSDVCSSDLLLLLQDRFPYPPRLHSDFPLYAALTSIGSRTAKRRARLRRPAFHHRRRHPQQHDQPEVAGGSEERRVGTAWVSTCRSRWWP